MMQIRHSGDRGHANHGWLDSRFSFSFADYYDPEHMGFSCLRVINEDRIAPGGGFPMHPHRNMEIITYVLEGEVEHRDRAGHGSVLKPGEVQYMSAGRGILHSEFNPSRSNPLHLLQIWIIPSATGGEPAYSQKEFPQDIRKGRFCPVASSDGREGSIAICQDATVYAATLNHGAVATHAPVGRRSVWVQIARGKAVVNGIVLEAGDAASIVGKPLEAIGQGEAPAEILLFDLP